MKKEPVKIMAPHRDNKPNFYCVKTTYHNTGKIESAIVTDEETQLPIAIEISAKPLDGVFETATATVYYTYHEGYKEAVRQVAMMNRQTQQAIHVVLCAYQCYCHRHFAENQIGIGSQEMFHRRKCHRITPLV